MNILNLDSKNYPNMLKNIKNAPKELYTEGNLDCFNQPCITVIGSRNMTEYGKKMTVKIVKDLTLAGMCIVSGLAVGIDSVAHQTCLDYGGRTIAVLGSGLKKVYPSENKGLFKRIINNNGCVITEYEPDTEAEKMFFPARNRIVSGLSLATLVIEATYRSGTSITAKFAFEQGKKVFCIPNSIGNKNSLGTINLIKRGAQLVTQANEILYELGIIKEVENYEELCEQERINKINLIEEELLSDMDNITKNIYFYIKEHELANLEIMAEELDYDIQSVNTAITILELKGMITNKSASYFSLRDEFYV